MIIDLRENGLAALNGGRESLLTFSFIFFLAKITRTLMREILKLLLEVDDYER